MTEAACHTAGGTYHGNGTTCSTSTCSTCPCDFNHDGVVNEADLEAFLTAYRAGNADVNGDGVTNMQDLITFMECFEAPGAGCHS
jgi:hypothetical protein